MKKQSKPELCTPHSHLSLVDQIMELPKSILLNHHKQGLADLILNKISSEKCFSFSKAAYLVDNPDFNYLKGICGFCKTSSPSGDCSDPDGLITQISSCKYNERVKALQQHSFKANNLDLNSPENLAEISKALEMQNPEVFCWDLKHNNYGVLIFESNSGHCCDWKKNLLEKVTSILGMCGLA